MEGRKRIANSGSRVSKQLNSGNHIKSQVNIKKYFENKDKYGTSARDSENKRTSVNSGIAITSTTSIKN